MASGPPVRLPAQGEPGSRPRSPPEPSAARIWTLPTVLTLARVAAVPAFAWLWHWPTAWAPRTTTSVFLAAAVTDFLDGYLARKLRLTSTFGAFLDPVADKLMVGAALVLLAAAPPRAGALAAHPWAGAAVSLAAATIISRELAMSALREWAAGAGPRARAAVAVGFAGKLKTTAQLASLTALCAARDAALPPGTAATLCNVGVGLLAVATVLTLWSLVEYFAALWPYMSGQKPCA